MALNTFKTRCVNCSDVLPLKAARHDSISNLTSFWGFESLLQTNPMPFHLKSLLMPLIRGYAIGRNNIVRVGKNSGPVFTGLWVKVFEILGQW